MQRYAVLFLRDPVIALDLAEMLAQHLDPIRIEMPKTADAAAAMIKEAICVVTDRAGARDLRDNNADQSVPYLYTNIEADTDVAPIFSHIGQPFTNTSVQQALDILGLNAQSAA